MRIPPSLNLFDKVSMDALQIAHCYLESPKDIQESLIDWVGIAYVKKCVSYHQAKFVEGCVMPRYVYLEEEPLEVLD